MEYRKLGKSDLTVSSICLGTMTFGQQNTEDEGHEQLDYALEKGINFIDTAEMYPVPGRQETQGATENIIGTWIKKSGKRNAIVLATKVTGPSPNFTYMAPDMNFTANRLHQALNDSLRRLQTDYIDLYQLHWPERKTNTFGVMGYTQHDSEWEDRFEDTIQTLEKCKADGKIRHWGISNETPWGLMRVREISKELQIMGPVSIQNPYNLLNRTFEIGLAEMAIREQIGLLAYSPLGFGRLTGKFLKGLDTPQDRINQFTRMVRYNSQNSLEATAKYVALAESAGISPVQMALAYVISRPFMTSAIVGATTMEQLKENLSSTDVVLSAELLQSIEAIHAQIPNPAP
jgi:aryl-alcohol dehydrogenase-like predicted oxidoreductase